MTAEFVASAAGYPLPITWQWQISDGSGNWADLTDGGGYSDVTTPRLKVVSPTPDMNGLEFRAVATNSFASAYSEPATLFVTDGSGI